MIEKSVYQELRYVCKNELDARVFFPDEDKEYTYQGLLDDVDSVSACLCALKVGVSDKVAVCGDNTSEWFSLLFAINKLGAVIVPINGQSTPNEIQYILERSEAKLLFYVERLDGNTILDIKATKLEKIIYIGGNKRELHSNEMKWEEFKDLSYGSVNSPSVAYEIHSIQFTSGTVANPKGVVIKQSAALMAAKTYGEMVELDEKTNSLMPIPLYYCFGNILVALSFFMFKASLTVMRRYSPQKSLMYLEKYRCTALCGVPAMFIAMMSVESFEQYNKQSLNKMMIGGSCCSSDEARKIVKEFGTQNIIIGYGLTEATTLSMASRFSDPFETRINTVGRPVHGMEAKIINIDNGNDVMQGEPGELLLKGWGVMKEYYGQPEETAKVKDSDGWLHTGDIAIECEDGFYQILGRIKDIIIRGGENISPAEIESCISTYPDIMGVQVVGVSDRVMSERIAAFICTENNKLLNIDEIVSVLGKKLPKHKIPEFYINIDRFSMTASGKIKKNILKTMVEDLKKEEKIKPYEWIVVKNDNL